MPICTLPTFPPARFAASYAGAGEETNDGRKPDLWAWRVSPRERTVGAGDVPAGGKPSNPSWRSLAASPERYHAVLDGRFPSHVVLLLAPGSPSPVFRLWRLAVRRPVALFQAMVPVS